MKIKGFLAILIIVAILVYFLWFLKAGKDEAIYSEIEAFDKTKSQLTETNIVTLERIIESFIALNGKAPDNLKEIQSIQPLGEGRWDAWGTAIKYEKLSDEKFRLISAGQDKTFNTVDDIVREN